VKQSVKKVEKKIEKLRELHEERGLKGLDELEARDLEKGASPEQAATAVMELARNELVDDLQRSAARGRAALRRGTR